MSTLPPLISPKALAMSEQFADGTWRDEQGRNLYLAIVAEIGPERAAHLWREAARMVDLGQVGAAHVGLPLAKRHTRQGLPAELTLVRGES
jgi:hypothetical protein